LKETDPNRYELHYSPYTLQSKIKINLFH
jgi:hypothetical protein